MSYGNGEKRAHRHGRAKLREPSRPGVAGKVRHSQRSGDDGEMLEERRSFGYLPQQLVLAGSRAGDQEFLYASRFIEGGDESVASVRQRPGAVQDALQHRVEVDALVDAQAGLAQPGEAVSGRLDSLISLVGILQFITPFRTAFDPQPGAADAG